MTVDGSYGICGQNSYGKKYYKNGKFYNRDFQEINNIGELVIKEEIVVEEPKKEPVIKAAPKRRGRKPAKKD